MPAEKLKRRVRKGIRAMKDIIKARR